MKRTVGLLVVSLLVVLSAPVIAQEATPGPPDGFEIAPGVTADSLVFTDGQENPVLYRLHFEPGVVYPVEPGPNLELVYMESGSLVLTLDAPVTIGQLGRIDTAGESISDNTEVTVSTGEFFVLQPGVAGEVRNEGDEMATVSIAGIQSTGMTSPAATPTG